MKPADGGSHSFDHMRLIERLHPICRSITGDGVRETLRIISEHVPLELREVDSGTPVLDWVVPPEWNIRDAYVADAEGRRVIDFQESNLHVVSYSVPVRTTMSLDELRGHLHTLPDHPSWIPYRTAYYEPSWGFCVSQDVLDSLQPGTYEVVVDSTLEPGSLSYGELVVPGRSNEEILVSAHVCHPSLCDDNLSGIAVAVDVARRLIARGGLGRTVRFLFAPGTIGAITWLARNRERLDRIAGGLTVTCLGDRHPFTYKRSHQGDSPLDRCVEHVLTTAGLDHEVIEYFPYGYDERQYNSPGFRVPVGSLMRGRHGQFPEYHTSADDLDFVDPTQMEEAAWVLERILSVTSDDRTLINLEPYGEPQLGRRGLYRALGGSDIPDAQLAMLWVLHLSDGHHSLLDIAARSGLPFDSVVQTAALLERHDLLRDRSTPDGSGRS
jgi:aminopeptidase-like protein